MPTTSPHNILHPDNTSEKATIEAHLAGMALSIQSAFNQTMPPGVIVQYVGASAPDGFLLCQGQAVSRTTYAALFAALGGASSPYGLGDGSTTFNLPNLQGRVPVGLDSSQTEFNTLANTGGAKTHTLTTSEMPSHTHVQDSHNHLQNAHSHGITDPGHAHTLRGPIWRETGGNVALAGGNIGHSVDQGLQSSAAGTNISINNTTATNIATTATNQNTGGGGAHNNLQPYIVVNYIVKH